MLLEYILESLASERIELPTDFFDSYLKNGHAVLLLDGMDEVADTDLRRRVSRLIEAFVRAYPDCRYIVSSRVVGYTDAARLGEKFSVTTVRDFTLKDVRQFLAHWHRLIVSPKTRTKDAHGNCRYWRRREEADHLESR